MIGGVLWVGIAIAVQLGFAHLGSQSELKHKEWCKSHHVEMYHTHQI